MKVSPSSARHSKVAMMGASFVMASSLTLLVIGILNVSELTHFLHPHIGLALLITGGTILPFSLLILNQLKINRQKWQIIVSKMRKPLDQSPGTSFFKKEEEIRAATHLEFSFCVDADSGRFETRKMSIDEIEQRARPVLQGRLESYQSRVGFLAPHEKFTDVVATDWETVRKLGYTHKELALSLSSLISYIYPDFINVKPHKVKYKGQNLELTYIQSKYQECLFSHFQSWKDHCIITHTETQAQIIWTQGAENYIEHMGFYEGGRGRLHYNEFRIDPIHLISILTGEPIHSLRERANVTYPCSCSDCFVPHKSGLYEG